MNDREYDSPGRPMRLKLRCDEIMDGDYVLNYTLRHYTVWSAVPINAVAFRHGTSWGAGGFLFQDAWRDDYIVEVERTREYANAERAERMRAFLCSLIP